MGGGLQQDGGISFGRPKTKDKEPEKEINFFELCENSLCYDILELIGDNLKADKRKYHQPHTGKITHHLSNPYNYCWDGREELVNNGINIARCYKHRNNIIQYLMLKNINDKELNTKDNLNIFERNIWWDYYNENKIYNRFLRDWEIKGLFCCDGEDLRSVSNGAKTAQYNNLKIKHYKINFGKYKNLTFEEFGKYYTSSYGSNGNSPVDCGNGECVPLWKFKSYCSWLVEKKVLDSKPLLKYFLKIMNSAVNQPCPNRFYD